MIILAAVVQAEVVVVLQLVAEEGATAETVVALMALIL